LSQTLTLTIRPSRFLALALTAMAVAALACAWIGLPRPAFVAVGLGIILAWGWHLALAKATVRELELKATGEVRCRDGQGLWQDAEILAGSYVSNWLIVVILGAGGRRLHPLVLLPDSAAGDDLRRLRAWLRWRLGHG
jgi:hypothetical protein